MAAPVKCPMCGEVNAWKKTHEQNVSFNVGKSVGGTLSGQFGLGRGIFGKKKVYYYCGKCGFSHEYRG